MPPRRGARRKAGEAKALKQEEAQQEENNTDAGADENPQIKVETNADDLDQANEPSNTTELDQPLESVKLEENGSKPALEAIAAAEDGQENSEETEDLPYKVKVSHLPAVYILGVSTIFFLQIRFSDI